MLVGGLLTWALVGASVTTRCASSPQRRRGVHVDGLAIFPAHLYTVFAVRVVVSAVLLGMTLFIGGVSKFKWIEDEDREWWGALRRLGADWHGGWMAAGAITIYGPPLLLAFPKLIAGVGGVSGLDRGSSRQELAHLGDRTSQRGGAITPGVVGDARAQYARHCGDRLSCHFHRLPVAADECRARPSGPRTWGTSSTHRRQRANAFSITASRRSAFAHACGLGSAVAFVVRDGRVRRRRGALGDRVPDAARADRAR